MIRLLVGQCHVGDSFHKVLAHVISKIENWDRIARPMRREVISQIIREHRKNRDLYRHVMQGM